MRMQAFGVRVVTKHGRLYDGILLKFMSFLPLLCELLRTTGPCSMTSRALHHFYSSPWAVFSKNFLKMLLLLVNSSIFAGAIPPFFIKPSSLASSLAA